MTSQFHGGRILGSNVTSGVLDLMEMVMSARWCLQGDVCKLMSAMWCLQGDVCKVMSAMWCLQGDVCKVMSAWWCLQGDVCKVMSARWCLHGDVCKLMSARWCLPCDVCKVMSARWCLQGDVCKVMSAGDVARWCLQCDVCKVIVVLLLVLAFYFQFVGDDVIIPDRLSFYIVPATSNRIHQNPQADLIYINLPSLKIINKEHYTATPENIRISTNTRSVRKNRNDPNT